MTAKTMAMALASLSPVPVSFAREGRDEQHINAIPKRSANSTKLRNPSGPRRFALSSPGASIADGPEQGAIAGLVVPLPQGREGDPVAGAISSAVPEAC